jgi:hypothetical protein
MIKEKVNKFTTNIVLKTAFALMLSINIFAQTQNEAAFKYAEYESPRGGSCDEFFRITDFLERINQTEGNKGLIVIYSGDSTKRFGNLLAYVSGAKQFLTERLGVPPEKFSFAIAEGKNLFNEEFWIIPENAGFPEIKPASLDWKKIETSYHFSETCLACEPSYYLLTSFQPGYEEFAAIIKDNSSYKGLITVGDFRSLAQVRKILTKNYKLSRNQFAIQIVKSKNDNDAIRENLYIVPKE